MMAGASPDAILSDGTVVDHKIGRGWKVKKTFRTDCDSVGDRYVVDQIDRIISQQIVGAARQVRMKGWEEFQKQYKLAAAQLQPVPPTNQSMRFTTFIMDCDPFKMRSNRKGLRLRCPKCGCDRLSYLTLQDDPVINNPHDVLGNQMQCIATTAGAGGVAGPECGHRDSLARFLNAADEQDLYNQVKNWLLQKAYSSPAHAPPGHTPAYRQFKVLYVRYGEQFECIVSMPYDPLAPMPDDKALEAECARLYNGLIDDFWAGRISALPSGIRLLNPKPFGIQHWMNNPVQTAPGPPTQAPPKQKCTGGPFCTCSNCSALYPQFKSAVKQFRPPPPPGGYGDEDDYNPSEAELEADHRAQHPTCEADKEIGTRDPDQYLKEERDRQLREMFGC